MISRCIQVKYLQATSKRGARLKAFDAYRNSVTIPFPYDCYEAEVYKQAALEFMRRYWAINGTYDLAEGQLANGDYVFIPKLLEVI